MEGTSAGAETDMLDEILTRIRQDGLVLQEVVADKDTSVNSTTLTTLRKHYINIWRI